MLQPVLYASLACCFAATACKSKEKTAAPADTAGETKPLAPAEAASPEDAPPAPMAELPPVEPDQALIDATLEKLADATIERAASQGLPAAMGEVGIACGGDEEVGRALQHIGFARDSLTAGKGFLFQDVCVGWRPYVTPATEMYWMISAGAPAEGEEVMPVRRCVQVLKGEQGFTKASIIDGPCLTMHRQE